MYVSEFYHKKGGLTPFLIYLLTFKSYGKRSDEFQMPTLSPILIHT